MVRGFSTDLPGQELFASERIPALKFLLRPSPLVLCVYVGLGWGVGLQDFGSGCSWRSNYSPLFMPQLSDLQLWSVVSEKQLSIFIKQDGTIVS